MNSEKDLEKKSFLPSVNWWDGYAVNIRIRRNVLALIFLLFILVITIIAISTSNFENKNYDPYGSSIRFLQSRDDTGSNNSTLEERQLPIHKNKSELTSMPEPPNFSENYGIDASINNGSVMIERENFENNALSLDELEKANKGF